MGEESTMPPPASKKAAMTARHSARSSGSSPTLKVIQLPMPTAGTGSPLAGMRFEIASAAGASSTGVASAAPAPTSTARRVTRMRSPSPCLPCARLSRRRVATKRLDRRGGRGAGSAPAGAF